MTGFTWGETLVMVISGGLVAWVPFGITQWQSHRALKAHIDDVTATQTGAIIHLTDDQTGAIAHLTADQTAALLAAGRDPGRADGPSGQYHGHEGDDGAGPGS